MLEGLDQVNWKNLGYHVYGRHETIPAKIRNLLSPNAEVREEARDFLLGGGQDFGDLYATTPRIIPFLIELLADTNTPDRADLLLHLSGVAGHIVYWNHSIYMTRLGLQVYDALKAGLDIFISLLVADSAQVRSASAELLQFMTDEVEYLIPELIARFRIEQDEEVQVALLKSLKVLMASLEWPRYKLKEQYAPFFKEVIETYTSDKLRVAAARDSVECLRPINKKYDLLSPQVPALLAKEFLNQTGPHYYFEAEGIVRDLARLQAQPLLDLLQTSSLTAEQAHLIARGLLVNAFHPGYRNYSTWQHWPDEDRIGEGMFYAQSHTGPGYYQGGKKHFSSREKIILQAIVDADMIWELPTNLFSFFYGLPDSREALRQLLTQ